MPEIQTKDKLITLEELGAAIDAKAGVTSVNNQTGAVSITPANIGAVAKSGDTMTGNLTVQNTGYEAGIDIRKNTRGIRLSANTSGICGELYMNDDGGGGWVWVVNAGENTINHRGKWDGSAVDIAHGGTGATTSAVTITNDYSSVLNAINAVKGTRIFPISIQKNGSASYTDMPSGFETHEWNLLLFGNVARMTALLHIYQTSSLYLRDFFAGNWITSWTQLH